MKKAAMALGLGFLATAAVKAPAPALELYIGSYPSKPVRGVSLWNNPKFRKLVANAAPNEGIRKTVLSTGVEAPVERQGSLLVAQACEPHNCGDHQWTVAVLLPNGPAAICYHDYDVMDSEGRWFVNGRVVAKSDGCWSGDHTDVPDRVFAALAKG